MSEAKSKAMTAYKQLLKDIMYGKYHPLDRLRIDPICDVLKVSPGAVREALSRLVSDGLVVAEEQRGFIVAPVSAIEMIQLTEVRIEIESYCLSEAIKAGDLDWEASILSSHHKLLRTPIGNDTLSIEWLEVHSEYHDSLVSACENRWWLRFREQLFAQAERYLSLHRVKEDIYIDVQEDHQCLMDAVLNRDEKKACDIMSDHLQKAADNLLKSGVLNS
ncbi:GntR family transcriptional regulator [Marinomonas posidonica]|uniref:GntR family transcriptional regulator n=1 Tax=Marinomonas posidonica TaxID=936476 RepID=UPI003735A858